ncbi:MAG: nuclear transport factor 2 family protein, partial [Phycisphaeraceae bacterium]|nr:nuclear transport factor 2 family protein [Phycisphaeraceae bacterium]
MKFTKTVILACLFALISMAPAIGQETPDIVAIRGGFSQALEDHDLDAIVSYFADETVFEFAVQGAPPMDSKEMIWGFFADQFSGSPDWHTSEGQVLTNGEIVVVEHAALGTNTGESSTGPATNNPWALPHLDIYEFEGEKIKRLTSYADYAGVLMQLGLLPAGEMPELVPSFTLPDAEPTGLSPVEADIEHMARYNGPDDILYAKMLHADAQIYVGPLGTTVNRDAWIALHEINGAGFS